MRALLLFAPSLLLAGACGDGGAAEERPPLAVLDAPDPALRPTPPGRLYESTLRKLGPWYEALERRVSPAAENWHTETVAAFAERTLERSLLAAIAGRPEALATHLAPNFAGATALRPATRVVRAAGGLSVERAEAPDGVRVGADGVTALVAALVAPLVGCDAPRVEAEVVECNRMSDTRFAAVARLHLAGALGAGGRQLNLVLGCEWEVGTKVTLAGFETRFFEDVALARRPFVELTEALVAGTSLGGAALWTGALESAGRTDRMIPSTNVYLGMHGMALGDVNGDGREDLYVARHGGVPNVLLVARADGTLADVSAAAEVDFLDDCGGVLIVDLDGDGARDLAVALGSDVVVCWNDGAGRFPERTRFGAQHDAQVYSLSAVDADGDGDLDLYDTRYFQGSRTGGAPTPYHDARNGAPNVFWRSDGARGFSDATAAMGLDHNNDRFSLAALWEDLDGDGDLDCYVTNDFGRNNLYRNEGGHFRDVAGEVGALDMAAGMGISARDVDLDGLVDLYVSNMYAPAGERVTSHPRFMKNQPLAVRGSYEDHSRGNSLLVGQPGGTFRDVTEAARTGPGGWAWGAVFTDVDNDGLADVLVPNGFVTGRIPLDLASFFWRVVVNASPATGELSTEYLQAWDGVSHLSQVEGLSWNGHERGYGYWNLGGRTFADASSAMGVDFEDDGRVALVCDWDGDGRLDAWIKNRTAPLVRFVHNRHAEPGSWVAFELASGAPNTEAVGARVLVEAGGELHQRRVYAGEGYLGGSSKRQHFGLGAATRVEKVTVEWPDGTRSEHADLAPGALYRLAPQRAPQRIDGNQTDALAALAPTPLEPRIGERAHRVPALDRLPFARLPLPAFEGEPHEVVDFGGAPLLLYLWASWDDASLAGLARVAASRAALEDAGLTVYPLSFDSVRHADFAHATIAQLDLAERGGRVDRRLKQLLEIVVGELSGPFEDVPLPSAVLFDAEGGVACLYLGEVAPDEVARDARALREEPPGRWPTTLVGGRWEGQGPRRALLNTAKFLRKAGEPELAAELEAAAARDE
jgi:hypothetical protein